MMTLANEQVVHAALARYETQIIHAVHGGWEDWRALSLAGRLMFPARSRACLVYDFIVQRAEAAFAGDSNVRTLRRDETIKFVFGDSVLLRFKKATDNGLGSNIQTQATLGFVDQQQDLPDLPHVQKVEVVYVLNHLQTQIEQVLVAARNKDVRLWNYLVMPETTAQIIPLPLSSPTEAERRPIIKVREKDVRQKKDTGEK